MNGGKKEALIKVTWVVYYPRDGIMIHSPWAPLISWFLCRGHIDRLCPGRDPELLTMLTREQILTTSVCVGEATELAL